MRIKKPSPAFVLAAVALFIALGGASYAAVRLPKDSVNRNHIADEAVGKGELGANSVGRRADRVIARGRDAGRGVERRRDGAG